MSCLHAASSLLDDTFCASQGVRLRELQLISSIFNLFFVDILQLLDWSRGSTVDRQLLDSQLSTLLLCSDVLQFVALGGGGVRRSYECWAFAFDLITPSPGSKLKK